MNEGQLLIAVAVLVWIIIRRFAGSPVGAKSMIWPLVLMVYGVSQIHGHLHTKDVVLLSLELLVSLVGGVMRAYTIKLYPRDGHLWQRYTVITLVIWIAMIAARLGFSTVAHHWGATISSGGAAMVAFGFSIFIESLVVAKRAAGAGVPIMPKQNRSDRRNVGVR